MDIIHMPVEIALIAYLMFAKSPLPQIRQERIWTHSARRAAARDWRLSKGTFAEFGLGWTDLFGTLEQFAGLFGKTRP